MLGHTIQLGRIITICHSHIFVALVFAINIAASEIVTANHDRTPIPNIGFAPNPGQAASPVHGFALIHLSVQFRQDHVEQTTILLDIIRKNINVLRSQQQIVVQRIKLLPHRTISNVAVHWNLGSLHTKKIAASNETKTSTRHAAKHTYYPTTTHLTLYLTCEPKGQLWLREGPAARRTCCAKNLLREGPAARRTCCAKDLLREGPLGWLPPNFRSETQSCQVRSQVRRSQVKSIPRVGSLRSPISLD
jgi:hypothetical protein